MLKWHEKSCFTCKYFRYFRYPYIGICCASSECLRLGCTLSITGDVLHDRARYCSLWEKRPKDWNPYTNKNPYWHDRYIPREELELLWKKDQL